MSEQEFYQWLSGYFYAVQAKGYGERTPPEGFKPIVMIFLNEDESYNRERMIANLPISEPFRTRLLTTDDGYARAFASHAAGDGLGCEEG